MHSNSFRLQMLMSLLLSLLYACMLIIHTHGTPLIVTQNPRSKKRHNTLETYSSNAPNQGPWGGTIYIYIYISYIIALMIEAIVGSAPSQLGETPGLGQYPNPTVDACDIRSHQRNHGCNHCLLEFPEQFQGFLGGEGVRPSIQSTSVL